MSKIQGSPPVNGLALGPIQQSLLYGAIDDAPALVFVADDDMNYLAVNNRACSVLGYSRDELLSMRVTDVVVTSEAPTLYERMMDERVQQGDVELVTKDGTRVPFIYEAGETVIAGATYWVSVGFVNSQLYARAAQLERALLSRVVIEQAKGVLIGRHGVDAATAFEALRTAARSTHSRLHDLAHRTVLEAQTPREIEARLPRGR